MSVSSAGDVNCGLCGRKSYIEDEGIQEIVTRSEVGVMPSWAKSDTEQLLDRQRSENATKTTRATVDERCLKCGHPQVEFYTMQLRSVDEGATVFYDCPKCKFTWSLNN